MEAEAKDSRELSFSSWPSRTAKYAESGSQGGFLGKEETTKLCP